MAIAAEWYEASLFSETGAPLRFLPRLKGPDILVCGTFPIMEIADRYAREGDTVEASYIGHPSAIAIKNKAGETLYHVRSASDAWGYEGIAEEWSEWIADMMSEYPWKVEAPNTASGLVFDILKRSKVKRQALPEALRPIFHDAIHQGPMILLSAYRPHCTEYDMRKAYLNSTATYLSDMDSYVDATAWKVSRILTCTGIVQADVEVVQRNEARMGPLPVRKDGCTMWPFGRITGTWHTSVLSAAIATGNVDVHKVHCAVVATKADKQLAKTTEIIRNMPAALGRLVYTRLWGSLGSVNRWECDAKDSQKGWIQTQSATDSRGRPFYRPDWAGEIAGDSAAKMILACNAAGKSLIAAHVDSIWCDADQELPQATWAIKGTGEYRGLSVGVYRHGDKEKVSGLSKRQASNALYQEQANKIRSTCGYGTWRARQWTHNPALQADAESFPHILDMW